MMKFELVWSDSVKATDPRIVSEGRKHTYAFEAGSMNDAKAIVRSFMILNANHRFSGYSLKQVDKESK